MGDREKKKKGGDQENQFKDREVKEGEDSVVCQFSGYCKTLEEWRIQGIWQ